MPPEGVVEAVKSVVASPATSLPVAPSASPRTDRVTHWKETGTVQRASTSPLSLSTDSSVFAEPFRLTRAKGWVLPYQNVSAMPSPPARMTVQPVTVAPYS